MVIFEQVETPVLGVFCEVWVKAEKRDAELQNLIAEQKLRTGRILGDLITEGQKSGEIRKQNEGPILSSGKELTQIGLTKKQSSTFQQIASIPQDEDNETSEMSS